MAAALAQQRFGDRIRTGFGGLRPAPELSAPMVQAMQRAGVDMGYRRPQPMDRALYGAVPDLTVVIGDGADQTMVPGAKQVSWSLAGPASSEDDALDQLRIAVDAQVDTLMQSLP
jgi:hypothetical protein